MKSATDYDSQSGNEMKWISLGKWEVMREEKAFRKVVSVALETLFAEEKAPKSDGKLDPVSDKEISRVLKFEQISERFFTALLKARQELAKADK